MSEVRAFMVARSEETDRAFSGPAWIGSHLIGSIVLMKVSGNGVVGWFGGWRLGYFPPEKIEELVKEGVLLPLEER